MKLSVVSCQQTYNELNKMFDFLLILVHSDLRETQNEVINLWFHFNQFNTARSHGISFRYNMPSVSFWKEEVVWIVLPKHIFFLVYFLIRSFALHIYDLESVRLNSDGNIPSFPMSHKAWNWKLETVQMLRSGRTVISFDIILSIIIMNCYHFVINIYVCVCGWVDVRFMCLIFLATASFSSFHFLIGNSERKLNRKKDRTMNLAQNSWWWSFKITFLEM